VHLRSLHRGSSVVALLALAVGTWPLPARGAGSNSTERRLVASVDRALPEALVLLERAVNLNSGTMNLAGVRDVGRLFQPRFEALGFRARWVEGAAWGRAGHLLAERPGRGPRVLLIGHLDTVFELDSPFQRFERLSDTTARGPGVIDMKGGIVVMWLALQALRETGALDRLQVSLVLMGDEEKMGPPAGLARRDLLAAARGAAFALGFEDGDGDPRSAVIARRGSTSWILRAAGRPAHSSQIFRPDIGSGAIFEAARILSAFHDSLAGEPYLTFNPGLALGGTAVDFDREEARGTAFGKNNVIAESTVVAGDLRTLTPEQLESAQARMRRIVAAHRPHTSATIEFHESYPPLAPTDANRRLLSRFDAASRDLGFGPVEAVDPARAGAADISFTAGLAEAALDGIGLMGRGGHTVEETADLRTLPMQAKRVAVLLARIAREHQPHEAAGSH
jgi:glutamate carboxypeptidase